jgi:hypothetical protein
VRAAAPPRPRQQPAWRPRRAYSRRRRRAADHPRPPTPAPPRSPARPRSTLASSAAPAPAKEPLSQSLLELATALLQHASAPGSFALGTGTGAQALLSACAAAGALPLLPAHAAQLLGFVGGACGGEDAAGWAGDERLLRLAGQLVEQAHPAPGQAALAGSERATLGAVLHWAAGQVDAHAAAAGGGWLPAALALAAGAGPWPPA